jgi:hypothetical protein
MIWKKGTLLIKVQIQRLSIDSYTKRCLEKLSMY